MTIGRKTFEQRLLEALHFSGFRVPRQESAFKRCIEAVERVKSFSGLEVEGTPFVEVHSGDGDDPVFDRLWVFTPSLAVRLSDPRRPENDWVLDLYRLADVRHVNLKDVSHPQHSQAEFSVTFNIRGSDMTLSASGDNCNVLREVSALILRAYVAGIHGALEAGN